MAPPNHPLASLQRRYGGTGGTIQNGGSISPGLIAGVIVVVIIAFVILTFIIRARRSRNFREKQANHTCVVREISGTNPYPYNEPVTEGEDGTSGAGVSRNWMGQIKYGTDPATGLKIPQPSLSRGQGWEGEMMELRGQAQKDTYSNQVGRNAYN